MLSHYFCTYPMLATFSENWLSKIYKSFLLPTELLKFSYATYSAVCAGDFNSQVTRWKYGTNHTNDEALMSQTKHNDMQLAFYVKERDSFKSAAWNQKHDPDFGFENKFRQVLKGSHILIIDQLYNRNRKKHPCWQILSLSKMKY